MSEKDHHVAWADRIGLNKQWARDIDSCGAAFGTVMYSDMVRRFKNNIPNINNGPQLKDLINSFHNDNLDNEKEKVLLDWKQRYPQEAGNTGFVNQKRDEINHWAAEELYMFMLQLLEDNGFGFYEAADVKTGKDGYTQYEPDIDR